VLVRSWNLFHGNAVPPERRGFLETMVRLVARDEPDVVCLQEVPVWALRRLEGWSGMQALGDVAQPPRIGPFPGNAELGRLVTELHHGLLRSTFTGQANAILVARRLRVLARDRIVLNAKRFRDAQARTLGLGPGARLAWAKERRVAQSVRLALPGGSTLAVANLHATSYPADRRLADAEIVRAGAFLEAFAAPEEPRVLAGDLNVLAGSSSALEELGAWGYAGGGHHVDHILARRVPIGRVEAWPQDRRRSEGRLLSDHAPLEAQVG
jgi:endonuclease/exonuclease/phosphatase family metal-dependent hydrolase